IPPSFPARARAFPPPPPRPCPARRGGGGRAPPIRARGPRRPARWLEPRRAWEWRPHTETGGSAIFG
ncbi:hypothetical protein, partial [Nocardia brasiliensis]|uniref:hypothetical protein n=1 Tax=Nocardia brasiliensis TaxID=37326 RepID=UPI00245744C2